MKKSLLAIFSLLTVTLVAQERGYVVKELFPTTVIKNEFVDDIKLQSTAGGSIIDLNNLLLGITDFAIEASKMELNIAFFNRFQKFLDQNPECKTLFPNTLQQLNLIRSFQFNEFLPKLRKSFFDDLRNFPENINSALSLPRYQKIFADFPEITVAIRSIATISKLKTRDTHLNEIIYELSQAGDDQKLDKHKYLKNYINSWKLINVLSTAFVDPTTSTYFIKDTLNSILKDKKKVDILIAGIINQIDTEKITFYDRYDNEIFIADKLNNLKEKRIVMTALLQNIVNAINDFEMAGNNMAKTLADKYEAKTVENKRQAALAYLDASLKCVDVISGVFNLLDIKADSYLNMVRNVTQISRDAIEQDYTSLVSNSIGFLESVFSMASSNATQDTTITKRLVVFSKLLKYANFAATVVAAKTPKEVKDAITAIALPPGSSSIKKNSDFNISLQLHLGGAVNTYTFAANSTMPSWKNRFNVTLPVGVSFNTGFGKGGSLGLFASIIDIGALAQFRLDGNNTSITEKIRFSNVLSPGVSLCYGLPCNIPLSLNFGGQFGPGLTKVTYNNNTIEKPSWRLLASLTVDIPAFTIVNVGRAQTKTTFQSLDFEITPKLPEKEKALKKKPKAMKEEGK